MLITNKIWPQVKKILFDDLSENIIYYRGISPGNATISEAAREGRA